MMQMRDWIVGFVPGIIIGAIGLLSLIGILPFELPRNVLVWTSAIGGVLLFYASIIEITNSNVMGTVSIIIAGIVLVISLLPALNSIGLFGAWAEFSWIGDIIYKIAFIVEGVFLAIATFAMEL
ncbi:hypothetical protein HY637_00295 [Candidatus Woesearchaeota archaeon]|nr:hypothetical protein [Candidatus Woesearchaeota archaeon]